MPGLALPAISFDSGAHPRTAWRSTRASAALDLIVQLTRAHGSVLFHQSGGSCDGSAPMCYPQGEFLVGDNDVRLGEVGGAPVYIGAAQFDCWKHTQLVIDIVPGQGGMFSLENGSGERFLTRSRVFSDAELSRPPPVTHG